MNLYRFYRISKPSGARISEDKVQDTYRMLRNRTFWGTTAAYSLFYLCRLSMGVVKKPLIDEGLFSAAQLGVIASAFYTLSVNSSTDSLQITVMCVVIWLPDWSFPLSSIF